MRIASDLSFVLSFFVSPHKNQNLADFVAFFPSKAKIMIKMKSCRWYLIAVDYFGCRDLNILHARVVLGVV